MKQLKVVLGLLLLATFLAGCASLPPVVAVKNIESLAGTYEGEAYVISSGRSVPVTWVIKKDGSYVAKTPRGDRPGTMKIVGGKIQGLNVDKQPFTATMHEGDGKRILATKSDRIEGKYTLVK